MLIQGSFPAVLQKARPADLVELLTADDFVLGPSNGPAKAMWGLLTVTVYRPPTGGAGASSIVTAIDTEATTTLH